MTCGPSAAWSASTWSWSLRPGASTRAWWSIRWRPAAGRRLAVGGVTRRTVAARTTVRGLAPGRTIGRRDVAIARADWEQARAAGVVCGTSSVTRQLDVDQDGCADIVDVQALRAARGRPGLGAARGDMPAAGTRRVRAVDGVASAPGRHHGGQHRRHPRCRSGRRPLRRRRRAAARCGPPSWSRRCSRATSPSTSTCTGLPP